MGDLNSSYQLVETVGSNHLDTHQKSEECPKDVETEKRGWRAEWWGKAQTTGKKTHY